MSNQLIELPYSIEALPAFASLLEDGKVIILRDVLPINKVQASFDRIELCLW